jgi:hypothetical protein
VLLIVYYVIFMIAGDLSAYLIGLIVEREFGSEASLIVFLALYFLFLWFSWLLGISSRKRDQQRAYIEEFKAVGLPRFRRDPFARDVAFDPGGTTMPRITALHMLRSPAISSFRGSIPHPTHQLCTLRVRRCRRLTQHSLPGGPLRPYLGRTCTG